MAWGKVGLTAGVDDGTDGRTERDGNHEKEKGLRNMFNKGKVAVV